MVEQADVDAWRERAVQTRRTCLIEAMAEVVCDEGGFAEASVAKVCARAGLSRRAFYESFDTREECFLAVLDEGSRRATSLVRQGIDQAGSWQEAVRLAHVALLTFFDAEPQLARVCVVESLAAGPWALERREQHAATFLRVVAAYPDPPAEPYPYASVGVMAASLAVVQRHLLADSSEPLIGLLGPLMGLAVSPYLDSRRVAEEVTRSNALASKLLANPPRRSSSGTGDTVEVPALLLDPRAWRAQSCVLYIARHPGASNRQVARGVGISSDTQISTLLARLAKAGLLLKRDARPGGPNAWTLTAEGWRVVEVPQGRDYPEGPQALRKASKHDRQSDPRCVSAVRNLQLPYVNP